jgi:hypothetical protein
MESANHVLALRMINSRLATDCRINLGQQCGRQLNKRDAALVTRRSKTRQVADHSTTQGDQRRVSATVIIQQGIKYQLQGAYSLVLLTIWQYLAAETPVFQGGCYPIKIKRCHPVIADNDDLITRQIG